MRFYFKKFIRNELNNKVLSNAYLFILWAIYKNLNFNEERYRSNYIKKELENIDLTTFPINEKRKTIYRILESIRFQEKQRFIHKRSEIKSIQISNFRGFGSEINSQDRGSIIDFDRRKNIFYAPNGGGKSSLCEALEYALTGDIKEATRRKTSILKYINREENMHSINLSFVNPEITKDSLNELDFDYFKKCFIEKNRIQEFALLGCKDTKTVESDIFATILGLEELDNLLTSLVNFRSFDLTICKHNNIKKSIAKNYDSLNTLEQERLEIKSEKELLYMELSKETEQTITDRSQIIESIDKLKNKIKDLDNTIDTFHNISLAIISEKKVYQFLNFSLRYISKYDKIIKEVNSKKSKIDIIKLYESLINLEEQTYDYCPACQTNLEFVKVNPFTNAKNELDKLSEVVAMEKEVNVMKKRLEEDIYNYIKTTIDKYSANIKQFPKLNLLISDELTSFHNNPIRIESIKALCSFLAENFQFYTKYFIIQKEIDSSLKSVNEKKVELEGYRNKLNRLELKKQKDDDLEKKLNKINLNINNVLEERIVVKIELKKEHKHNRLVNKIQKEYRIFIDRLTKFKKDVEEKQLLGIEKNLLNYYNKINIQDSKDEQITKIKFELVKDNYRIYIKRKNTMQDAFIALSEGHIRSLGLSLILAVALKYQVPFLVFDDVVNAIDSEHRANIIKMIYSDQFLSQTQLIFTTHDRLFWERFCNSHPRKDRSISYILEYSNMGIIHKQYDIDFESKIQKALEVYDIRQALVYCRIWFETLTIFYLKKKRVSVKATFNEHTKNNFPQPSLECIYNKLDDIISNKIYLNIIKKDLLNWTSQNQEHHSFDEQNYNFVHSKNSDEVQIIFDAIKGFESQLNELEQSNDQQHNEKLELMNIT